MVGGRAEGGKAMSMQFRDRISHSPSLKHKANLLLNVPGMDSPVHRGMRLIITNSHSKTIILDHSKVFLLPVRQHYRKKKNK